MSHEDKPGAVDTHVLIRLQEQTGDEDGELLQELVAVFVEDAQETCQRLATLAQEGPSETLSREAHRLKSGAANLGATTMTALCKELEHKGESDTAEALMSLVSKLASELQRVEVELRHYVAQLGASLAQSG